ncbi:ABC transporter permease [Butyrivibrio sp. INlla16]|uniref:ABC transporter permease n=1 Tax=Butyrivibrio sp. INlla16 TaxID=1520807 RepID=UPI00087E307D|nr:ABC transporter permease [Butyrivibrio sp. INlla16]SDB63058.1 ABC-type polysaccharide/polyol phosphate export permease [Butyrivibrio sp. INlla16]
MMNYLKSYFSGIYKDRYVLSSLVKQDLHMKYNRSILGVAWQLITPLGLSIIIGGIYSIIYGMDASTLIPVLFSGLNPWLFLSASADGGTGAYINAEGYLKQTQVSPQIFPIRVVLVAFVNLIYSMAAFFLVYLVLSPSSFGIQMLMFIPGMLIILIAGMTLANISSAITVSFRDFQPLQSLVLQGLFYITPIIYTTSMMDDKGFSIVYRINPFYYFINVVRAPALGTTLTMDFIVEFICVFLCLLLAYLISAIITMKNNYGIAMKL